MDAALRHLGPDLWAGETTEGAFPLALPWVRACVLHVLATCPSAWIPQKDAVGPLEPSLALVWTFFWGPAARGDAPVEVSWAVEDGFGHNRVVLVTTERWGRKPPRRPALSVLATTRLREALLALRPPEWETRT